MDIKLKNRHRISLFLSAIVVLGAALIMVWLYPYFEQEANRNKNPVYEEQEFLSHLVSGNYVLDLEERQYEQGVTISPFEHFFPNASEELSELQDNQLSSSSPRPDTTVTTVISEASDTEGPDGQYVESQEFNISSEQMAFGAENQYREGYYRDLRQQCVMEYENWSRNFGSIRKYLDYQILDADGTILMNHSNGQDIQKNDSYVFKAALRYDQLGRMDVISIKGENSDRIINSLQQYGDIDPMKNYYSEEFLYDTASIMSNPKSKTFIYGMTESQMTQFGEEQGYYNSSYYYSNVVDSLFLGLACAVAILAFLLSFMDATRADDSKLLRTPIEIVFCVGVWGVAFGLSLTNLVALTNRGDLYRGLVQANFLPQISDVLAFLWNVMWWCLPFAAIYWSVLCVRDVFHIGLLRYLRERTMLGWFCGWVKHLWIRAYNGIRSIDLQENSSRTIIKIVGINFLILTILCSLWFFGIGALIIYSVILFIIMQKYYRDLSEKYRILLKATNKIAEGDLEVTITEDLGVFEPFKTEIQKIQSGFKVAVDEEVKSQKLKTDLISNMSHDLKTPLTAIITYVNLLKDRNITPEQQNAYIDVLEQKSMRLKSLIEDLFEISKANSNNVTLNLVDVDIVSLLKEVSFELSDKIEESTLDFRWNLPDEKIVLPLDSQKTYRIFDNLLTNIIKYAMQGTRAYIDMKKENGCVVITMRNVSASELTFNPQEITDRFVRGDQSRNTEGSGLGMAIAKSFVELQNGRMIVETEADLFRVMIKWPIGHC